jgi:hypothetical protein
MTGVDVTTAVRVSSAPAGTPPDDTELFDLVNVPDAQRARELWSKLKGALGQAIHLRWGADVSKSTFDPNDRQLTLATRREMALRAKYRGLWSGPLSVLDRFTRPWPTLARPLR